jgi:hypothetical protein
MTRHLILLLMCLAPAVCAQPWAFGDVITVADGTQPPHYHHLDGAGRRHVAASAGAVALVWEDDRSGAPQVYFASKPLQADAFAQGARLSDGEEAYEPAIVALEDGRWLAAWEQDGAAMARVIDAGGVLGPVRVLAGNGGRQVTLASDRAGRIAAVWAAEYGQGLLVEAAELRVDGREIAHTAAAVTVAPLAERALQGYPTAVWGREGRLIVAWEDRRAGHTRLFFSWRDPGRAFVATRQLNEHFAPQDGASGAVRLGSGVMRVILASDAADSVRAVWLDKRDAASGYAVWGAASDDGGRSFGPNEIVQDALGAAVAQWHAALAGGSTGFVAAWDDARERWGDSAEPGDVLLSWRSAAGWSPDLIVPGASGAGYQGSPALAFDPHGDLHLAWIDRADLSAPTRLRYLHGRAARTAQD